MILYNDCSYAASLNCATTAENYKIGDIVSNNPGVVWRSTDTQSPYHYITFAFPTQTPLSGIAFIHHNLVAGDDLLLYGSDDNFATSYGFVHIPVINSFLAITMNYKYYSLRVQKNNGFAQFGKIYLAQNTYSLEDSYTWDYTWGNERERNSKDTISGQINRSERYKRKTGSFKFENTSITQSEILDSVTEAYAIYIYNQKPYFGVFDCSVPSVPGPDSAAYTLSFKESPA